MKNIYFVVVFVLLLSASAAIADLPGSRTESYLFHADPENPDSAVIRTVDLHLTPLSFYNDTVTWQVDSVTVTEFNESSEPTRAWSKDYPSLDTLNGYWLVAHSDVMNPLSCEFSMPPAIIDNLNVLFGDDKDLHLEFQGEIYTASSGGPPWNGHVAAITSVFRLADSPPPPPIAEGEAEPVETTGGEAA